MTRKDVYDRLNRLESLVEQQRQIIDQQSEEIDKHTDAVLAGEITEENGTETEPKLQLLPSGGQPTKVIGSIADDDGIGVFGEATGSGITYGVRGDAPEGYGLYTPDDTKLDGALVGQSLTDNDPLTSLIGTGLAIDGDGALNYTGPTYQNTTLSASGATWDPVGTLSSATRVEITVDTVTLPHGRARVDVDGSRATTLNSGDVLHRIMIPSSTLTVNAVDGWRHDKSFDTSVYSTGIAFKSDGTKMFLSGGNDQSIFSYDLSTAWDVTTASTSDSYDVSSEDSQPEDLSFKDDGTKMYVAGDQVTEYDLSSPWDVTSATQNNFYFFGTNEYALTFRDDGKRMYTVGIGGTTVVTHELSTAWDISTASAIDSTKLIDTGELSTGIKFTSDGSRLYLSARESDTVYVFTLSTAWDVPTASLLVPFDVGTEATRATSVTLKADDSELFLADGSGVYSYDKGFSGPVHASIRRE